MQTDKKQQLIDTARKSAANAYAPYSNFNVGAAILSENDNIFAGCNVENAAYPLTQCAEASAIGAMVTAGETKIKAVVVTSLQGEFCSPCGGCRQKLAEFCSPDTPVLMVNNEGHETVMSMGELLPASFDLPN